MTIEQTLERIATSCERNERLTEQLIASLNNAATHQVAAAPAVPAPVQAAPVVAAPAPVVAPVTPAAPVVEAPLPTATNCPITDQPSLVAYVMSEYKNLGPVRGNQIQGVLAALGITNINEATTAHYPAIHAGVEALKAQ